MSQGSSCSTNSLTLCHSQIVMMIFINHYWLLPAMIKHYQSSTTIIDHYAWSKVNNVSSSLITEVKVWYISPLPEARFATKSVWGHYPAHRWDFNFIDWPGLQPICNATWFVSMFFSVWSAIAAPNHHKTGCQFWVPTIHYHSFKSAADRFPSFPKKTSAKALNMDCWDFFCVWHHDMIALIHLDKTAHSLHNKSATLFLNSIQHR